MNTKNDLHMLNLNKFYFFILWVLALCVMHLGSNATVHTKYLRYDWGAVGDGLVNDQGAFYAAKLFIDSVQPNGDTTILYIEYYQSDNITPATYLVGTQIDYGGNQFGYTNPTQNMTRSMKLGVPVMELNDAKNVVIKTYVSANIPNTDGAYKAKIKYKDGMYYGAFLPPNYTFKYYVDTCMSPTCVTYTPGVDMMNAGTNIPAYGCNTCANCLCQNGLYRTLYNYANYDEINATNSIANFSGNHSLLGGYDDNKTICSVGVLFNVINCKNIRIENLELDGNNTNQIWGSRVGDVGIQALYTGINCYSIDANALNHVFKNLYIHHFGLDGMQVYGKANKVEIDHCNIEYNGRQALSLVGGKNLKVTNSQFNHTGRAKGLVNGGNTMQYLSSAPGAGVDIETEGDSIVNCYFSHCVFENNAGAGIENNDDLGKYIKSMVFDTCTIYQADNDGLYVKGRGFTFNDCNIWTAFRGGYGGDSADVYGTSFVRCNFVDTAYNGVANSVEAYAHPLINAPTAKHLSLKDCRLTVRTDNREMFNLETVSNEADWRIIDNCEMVYANGGSPSNIYANPLTYGTSVVRNVFFKNKNVIRNVNADACSFHGWQVNESILVGSDNACAPASLEMEGQFELFFYNNQDVFNIGRKINPLQEGYANVLVKNKSLLKCVPGVQVLVNNKSKLEIEEGGMLYCGGNFGIEGQFVTHANSYMALNLAHTFTGNGSMYIDTLTNPGNATTSPFWVPQGCPYLAGFANVPNWITANANMPCVNGGHTYIADVANGFTPCTPTYTHISTNGAFSIMYNLTSNGGNTDISFTPNGNNFTISFDGVQLAPNASSVTGIANGCHLLIVTNTTSGCSAVAFITTGANTAPCCEPTITDAANLVQLTNPTTSGMIAQWGALITGKSFVIDGNMIVDQSVTFADCTFYMRVGSAIVLYNGVVLTLTSCTLKGACDAMWDGIYLLDPSMQLIMNTSTMQDAENGILLYESAKCSLTNNTFINNHENVQIFGNTNVNNIAITQNLFTSSGTMLNPYASEKPLHGIFIDNSSEVNIGGLNNANNGNRFVNIWNGVTSYVHSFITGVPPFLQINVYGDSKIQLFNNEFKHIVQDEYSLANISNNEVGVGVYALREDAMGELRVNVYNTLATANNTSISFDNCGKGVWLRRASGNIDKQKLNACGMGIVASECEGKRIRVNDNELKATYLNIVKTGDEASNGFFAMRNKISLPHDYGWIMPVGIISGYSSQVHVGRSTIQYNTIDMQQGYSAIGIYISEGNADKITNNEVHMSTYDESPTGIPKMMGIYSNNSDGINISANTIDNGGGWHYVRTNSAGIYINNNKNSVIQCNSLDYTKFGIFAVGQNGSNTQYDRTTGNYMNNSDANLMLWKLAQEGTMGQVGIDDQNLNFKYDANNLFNEPLDINPSMTTALFNKVFRITDCPQLFNDEIVTTSAKLDQSKSSVISGNILDCKVTVTNPATFTSTYTCPVDGNNNNNNNNAATAAHPMDYHYAMQVASGQIDYSDYLEGARLADKVLVQQWLANNDSSRTSSVVLDSFYYANNAGIVGKLYAIDLQISLLNDSTLRSTPVAWMDAYNIARNMNTALGGAMLFEQNAKYMNDLYLNTLLRGSDTLDAEQQTDVETLAFTCPYLGGNAVYRARILHGMKHIGIHYDDLEICNGQGVFKNGKSKLEEQLDMLKNYTHKTNETRRELMNENEVIVYPNPANTFINVVCKNAKQIIIYNLLGQTKIKKLLDEKLNENKVETKLLDFGIYFYKIIKIDNSVYTGKLIIE